MSISNEDRSNLGLGRHRTLRIGDPIVEGYTHDGSFRDVQAACNVFLTRRGCRYDNPTHQRQAERRLANGRKAKG